MELIVDTNIIISCLISPGATCDLVFSGELELYAPEFLLSEIAKHKHEILTRSGLSEDELTVFLALIFTKIKFVSFGEFKNHITKAKEISPDVNDTEYFALALKLSCPIWSNDKELKKQNIVKISSTQELLNNLEN